MLHFDEPSLLAMLRSLPVAAQSAFAQACAIRVRFIDAPPLAPESRLLCAQALRHGRAFTGAGIVDRSSLEGLWFAMQESEDLDDDRVAAHAYVVRHLLSHDAQEAAWAARRSYEACDALAQSALKVEFNSKAIEVELLEHASVQAELHWQAIDLEDLGANSASASAIVARAAGMRGP